MAAGCCQSIAHSSAAVGSPPDRDPVGPQAGQRGIIQQNDIPFTFVRENPCTLEKKDDYLQEEKDTFSSVLLAASDWIMTEG